MHYYIACPGLSRLALIIISINTRVLEAGQLRLQQGQMPILMAHILLDSLSEVCQVGCENNIIDIGCDVQSKQVACLYGKWP